MKIIRKSQTFSRSQLLSKRESEMEINNEKKALECIQKLPDEMIDEIRSYICGFPKEIIEKEVERKRRQWYKKMLCGKDRWHFLEMIEKIDKKKLIRFIYEGTIKKYPEIINHTGVYLVDETGYELIEKWRKGKLPEIIPDSKFQVKYDTLMKVTISGGISSFIPTCYKEVQKLEIEELNKYVYLYKSILYVVNKMKK
jgi:hypothetical protein